ncbi:MAG: hypothetical protein A2007_01440 [Verrucomicrobia bacterium GWC2_42_7]|nr:MAG: hypothetical protein A2007_01440 [Verrucomicrobia bacterium GWC2_42_7]
MLEKVNLTSFQKLVLCVMYSVLLGLAGGKRFFYLSKMARFYLDDFLFSLKKRNLSFLRKGRIFLFVTSELIMCKFPINLREG